MLKLIRNKYYQYGTFLTIGMLAAQSDANAATNTFAEATTNMINSMANLTGLLSVIAYIIGTLLGVLGILKIKDHVENPGQTPLKDGAVRLGAGAALLALPFLFEIMENTFDGAGKGATVGIDKLSKISLNVG